MQENNPVLATAPLKFSEKVADRVAKTVGSWRFIILQSGLIITWMSINLFTPYKFDPYPFILLNLALSFQAAYTAPIIMQATNRQEQIDRQRSINMYKLEQQSHSNLELLLSHLDNHFDLLNKRLDAIEEKTSS